MYSTLFVLTGLLGSIVSAIPNNRPSCKAFIDEFEDPKVTAVAPANVDTYNGVTYQGFQLVAKSPVTGSTEGVVPHSGSQDIVTGVRLDATQLGTVTLNPFGNIIVSPSKAFDLYSFWFGCSVAAQQGVAGTSSACVLSVVGFTCDEEELPVITFSYSPNNPLAAPMVLAELPSTYRLLKNVTMGLAASTGAPDLTALWLDDVSHCNY